ncbi:hypothetical protein AHiyo8_11880 [Arthrobacter sp. Hiyo8]|nr:hypothetical protein AHiyo8_11880 [Arthrobacter sp. Hiyo8]
MNARIRAAAAATPPAAAKSLKLTPPKNNPAAMMSMTTREVPRSCPRTIKVMMAPETGTTGISACVHLSRSFALTERTVAIQSTSANLANSDGWKVKPPISIQFWLPSTRLPMTRTSTSKAPARMIEGHANRLSHRTLTLESTSIATMPIAANMPCLVAMEYGDSPAAIASTLDADRTMMIPMAVSASEAPRIK